MNRCCPICNSLNKKIIHDFTFNVPKEYYLATEYRIVTCQQCGMGFLDFDTTKSDYGKYYTEVNMYAGKPAQQLGNMFMFDLINRNLEKDSKILDVGIGACGLLLKLKNEKFNDICGLDPSAESIEFARNLGIDCILGDAYEDNTSLYKKFDAIIVSACYEHFEDPNKITKNLINYLTKDGHLIICVPNINYIEDSKLPLNTIFNHEHINYFSRETFIQLMKQFNMLEIDCIHQKDGINNESMYYGIFQFNENIEKEIIKDTTTFSNIKKYLNKELILQNERCNLIDKLVEQNKKIVIWGASTLAITMADNSKLLQGNILSIVDNNKFRWNKEYLGFIVKNPESLKELKNDYLILILVNSKIYIDEIIREITDKNLNVKIISLIEF